MDLSLAINKIDRYLNNKDVGLPLIVDVQNQDDLQKILTHYDVDGTTIIKTSKYCKKDEFPQLDSLMRDLMNNRGTIILRELSIFLKLQGSEFQKKFMSSLINTSIKGHIVVVTLQIANSLNIVDPRIKQRIVIVEGKSQSIPNLVFVPSFLNLWREENTIEGIDQLSNIFLKDSSKNIYVITSKKKKAYPNSQIYIDEKTDAYDVLIDKDNRTSCLPKECGTEEQWKYALSLFIDDSDWETVIGHAFDEYPSLEMYIQKYSSLSKDKAWLFFIGLKLFSSKSNWCLNKAIENTKKYGEFIDNLYKSLLYKSISDDDFWECYESRKTMLKQLGNCDNALSNYCNLVVGKEKDSIYYLTDNTQLEKEQIFKYLDQFGSQYNKKELQRLLKSIYPALSDYLCSYDFNNDMLTKYFDSYKYQKVINKVLPEFISVVEDQAVKREYNLLLQPRASKVENLKVSDSQLYFIDALGVEYLGYIVSQCNAMNLLTDIQVCRCELPSITSMNKEFISIFENSNHKIKSIKEIDQIKHHGKNDFDYYKGSKLPIHLIRELEVIYEVLNKIKKELQASVIKRAYIISDHGASRLAVLHDTENLWRMKENGQHSGRCCLKSDLDDKISLATDAGDFWVLANYDRFKGGRKANVEVHGGATLEEICVPIIEITYQNDHIEAFFLRIEDTEVKFDKIPEIEVSFRKKAAIKLFITSPVNDVTIKVNGEQFYSENQGNGFYMIVMPELKKAGTYLADVYSGTNLITKGLKFIIKLEGQQINDLL